MANANANFYLKDTSVKEETLIYLFFSYSGKRLKFSTGEKISPRNWNPENQRVKKSFTGSSELNGVLDNIEEEVKKIHRTGNSNGISHSIDELRAKLITKLKRETVVEKSFFDYLNEFIELNKGVKKISSIKKYITIKNHLKKFEQSKKFKVSFENMDARFYESFFSFSIKELHLLNNTFGRYVKVLKTFLNWATEREYNTNLKFKKFKVPNTDVDIIYLTENELMKLYEFDFSKNKRLEQVRDTFCFGCFTGLRFSDVARLKKVNIKGDEMHLTTQKTKDSLIIPLNDFAKEILKKYDCKLPAISNQKSNDYLKEMGEIVGIDEQILKLQYKGSEEIKIEGAKYNFISTHTMRRTFITLSLEKGMRAETVMSISGHKDYKTFKKYIKITNKVKMIEMKEVWNKKPQLKKVV